MRWFRRIFRRGIDVRHRTADYDGWKAVDSIQGPNVKLIVILTVGLMGLCSLCGWGGAMWLQATKPTPTQVVLVPTQAVSATVVFPTFTALPTDTATATSLPTETPLPTHTPSITPSATITETPVPVIQTQIVQVMVSPTPFTVFATVIKCNATIRAKADIDSQPLTVLPCDYVMPVIQRASGWTQVYFIPGVVGWIRDDLITVGSNTPNQVVVGTNDNAPQTISGSYLIPVDLSNPDTRVLPDGTIITIHKSNGTP